MKPNKKESEPQKDEKKMQVMVTQAVFCGILILFMLIVRLIGGSVFLWLSGTVNHALQDDSLLTGLSSRFYGSVTTTTTTVAPILIETITHAESTNTDASDDDNPASTTTTSNGDG